MSYFKYGIYLTTSSNLIFENMTIYNNSLTGFHINSVVTYLTLRNIDVYNNLVDGIYLISDYSILSNISSHNNVGTGLVHSGSNLSFNNITSRNNGQTGILLTFSNSNYFTNLNVYNNTQDGIYLYDSRHNMVANSSIINNTLNNIYFYNNGLTVINNTFYNNYLGNSSKIGSQNWGLNLNYFNYTIPGIGNVGNYWNNLTCINSVIVGSYDVCTNPNNYSINTNHKDYAPLVVPSISVNYTQGPQGNYYSQSVYIEVNASKNISSCTLYWNLAPVAMTVSGNTCYITQSGTFGNTYTYNVGVVGTNSAFGSTVNRNLTMLDLSLDYLSPPTLANNVKKYNLSNITIEFSDNGGNFTNCLVQVNNQNYSMSYSGGICTYTYAIPVTNATTQSITFQGFYNLSGSVTSLETRTITVYTDSSSVTSQNKVPLFGLYSAILFILTLIGGFFIN